MGTHGQPTPSRALVVADQGSFYVGGEFGEDDLMRNQMFVQFQIPEGVRRCPIVMIHGGGRTGVDFLSTPDGRPGWASFFAQHGHPVYVIDQPGRGRSRGGTNYRDTRQRSAGSVASLFTAPSRAPWWPQAGLHTQWPGSGVPGDSCFDQFFAGQQPSPVDLGELEDVARSAAYALLARTGPALLLGHSQGASLAWHIADSCPDGIAGIVAVEPTGPPGYDVPMIGPPDWFGESSTAPARPWGITSRPLSYESSASEGDPPHFVHSPSRDPLLADGWLQAEPARRLANLAGIPTLIVTGEASYHAAYDHHTSSFLSQAGVAHEHVRLADAGIRGNGHFVMLESNSLEVAGLVLRWIRERITT
jgi:pimeloyl-ACP methyl ester carboxylesterase